MLTSKENESWAVCVVCQCVKALVYYDVQTCRLDLQNDKGDAALHMAARWGYEGIIQVLLENGASTDVVNKNKDSPLQCALNSKVSSCCGGSRMFVPEYKSVLSLNRKPVAGFTGRCLVTF